MIPRSRQIYSSPIRACSASASQRIGKGETMSEVTIACNGRSGSRWQLLTTASAAALLVFLGVSKEVMAADDAAAPFWIELGGQFAQQDIKQENYLPAFVLATPRPPFIATSPVDVQKPPPSSWDGSLKIAYEPVGTDWVFS